MSKENNIFGKTIFTYTKEQAVEDGMLLDLKDINADWEKGIFSHVTSQLVENGYMKDNKLNLPNLLDLLNQANQIVKKVSKNFTEHDTFFAGSVETPFGDKQKIFMAQNSLGKFTIMLPEDY